MATTRLNSASTGRASCSTTSAKSCGGMRRLVLLEHISLDGYLAGPNGDMDWISVDDELWDYVTPIIDAADTAVYGRTTYHIMQSYWPVAADMPDATPHDIHHSRWAKTATKLV